VRCRHRPYRSQRLLRQQRDVGRLVDGQVLVLGHVTVRQHHQVAGVVRVQVEYRVADRATRHHQVLGVVALRDPAERALLVDGR
jgi:hypothetical protein